MNLRLQEPSYLWLLLIPVLLWLWQLLFTSTPVKTTVPELRLWLAEDQWQRPRRRYWQWLIWALLFGVLTLALARPLQEIRQQQTVILLDNSASMAATELGAGGKTRWEIAGQWVAQYQAQGLTTLVLTTPTPRRLLPTPLASPATLLPTDVVHSAGQPTLAWNLAATLAGTTRRLVIISDGAGPEWVKILEPLAKQPTAPLCHLVGKTSHNCAVRLQEAYRTSNGQVHFGVEIVNYDSRDHQGNLCWQLVPDAISPAPPASDQTAAIRKIAWHLSPQSRQTETIVLPASATGTWRCFLDTPDALAGDNQQACVIPAAKKARVLVISSRPQPYLLAALAAYPSLVDHEASMVAAALPDNSPTDYDLVIVCEKELPGLAWSSHFLLWNTEVAGLPLDKRAEPLPMAAWNVRPDNALAVSLDISGLQIYQPLLHQAPTVSRIIADGSDGALIWEQEHRNKRCIYVAFSLENSSFPLLPAFPVFIHNVLLWATNQKASQALDYQQPDLAESDIAPFAGKLPQSEPPIASETRSLLRHCLWIAGCLVLLYGFSVKFFRE